MIIDADKIPAGMSVLSDYLNDGVVGVKFTKLDGTERVMNCTQCSTLIPKEHLPTREVKTLAESDVDSKAVHHPASDLLVVFDTDAGGWRSFHYTQVKSISVYGSGGFQIKQ